MQDVYNVSRECRLYEQIYSSAAWFYQIFKSSLPIRVRFIGVAVSGQIFFFLFRRRSEHINTRNPAREGCRILKK